MESGFVDVNGSRLHYQVEGTGNPVVLLHGFSLDLNMWNALATSLSGTHRVIRYDLRGFGKSPPSDDEYSHAEDLHGLLNHLKIDKAVLMGLSLGGGAAINFSLLYPSRVVGLVVIDPSLGGFPWSENFKSAQGSLRTVMETEGREAALKKWLALPMFRPSKNNPETKALVHSMVMAYSGWHWNHPDRGLPLRPPAIGRLGDLSMPTLIVVGEKDIEEFQRIGETIHQKVPHSILVKIKNAGHLPNLENAMEFNETIVSFLQDHVL